MKADICICVPTADREEMLADVLSYELKYYKDFGIDVIIYDTSKTTRTEELVKKIASDGSIGLRYQRVLENRCLDYKLVDILKNDKRLRDYRYIWLMNDSNSVLPEGLKRIRECVDSGLYDLIRLPIEGQGEREDFISRDVNEWFHYASQGLAHMANTLMKTDLLEGDIDWEGLRKKYVGPADIASPEHGFFFMVGFYLERISQMTNFCALRIGNYMHWRRESPLKRNTSYWNDMIFEVWLRSYSETIFKLPSCYTDKEAVIRKSENIIFKRFEEASLITLRLKGQFSRREADKYRPYWHLVSTVPLDRIYEISETPVAELQRLYGTNFGDMDCWQENLENILATAGQIPIVVYGAGKYGGCVVEYLLHSNLEKKLVGIAVSNVEENVGQVYGVEVRCIDEYMDIREKALVLIAILPDIARGIRESLQSKGFLHIRELFRIGEQ